MGSSIGWREYIGDAGSVIAINQFGASAPESILLEKYGFTVENVVKRFKELNK
jgi:transketolase